jgi:NADH-quinone oxidoreductase subunit N
VEIAAPPIDLGVLAPLLVVLTGAFIIVLVDLFLPPERRPLLGYLAVGTTLVAIGACVPLWDVQRRAYYDMVTVDRFAIFASIAILAGTALALLLSIDYLASQGLHLGEYYPLVLICASGMLIMAIGNDLIVLFLGLEVLSIALYVLSGFARGHAASEESALKYFLLGSFSFGFLVYGTSLIYGAAGTTNFTGLSSWLRSDGRSPFGGLTTAEWSVTRGVTASAGRTFEGLAGGGSSGCFSI